MIDALAPALGALESGIAPAATAARNGAQLTASIVQAKAGRAAYVPAENLEGHNDPGAEAVALVFEGLAEKLPS
jgi:dihydroxyacetone kinase